MPTVEEQLGTLNNAVAALAAAVGVSQTTMNANVSTAAGSATSASNSAAEADADRIATGVLRDAMQTLSSSISSIALAAGSGPATSLQYPALAALLATATDVVDVFVYDTRRDSDGGKWTAKCSRTSWWAETLGTATRGARRDFPKIAALVLRNMALGTNPHLTIYDLTDLDVSGVPRMWAVFQSTGTSVLRQTGVVGSTTALNTIFALNGRIWVGAGVTGGSGTGGLIEIDLPNDTAFYAINSAATLNSRFPVGLSQRNTYGATWTINGTGRNQGIIDRNVFHVHARVLPGAPLDDAGLPIPTVAVATPGGTSVIHPTGRVASITNASAHRAVQITPDGWLFAHGDFDSTIRVYPIPYSDGASSASGFNLFRRDGTSGGLNYGAARTQTVFLAGGDVIGGGTNPGALARIAPNYADSAGSMVAYAATNYATGWLPGDCRLASLCDVTTGNITGTANLIANGDFPTDLTGWTITAAGSSTAVVTSGQAVLTSDGANAVAIDQSFATVAGQSYVIPLDVVSFTGGGNYSALAGTSQGGSQLIALTGQTASGRVFLQFTATGATSWLRLQKSAGAGVLTVDNVSCQLAIPDRSYRGRGLIPVGTIGRAAVASGDVVAFSGFGASNYLEQPYNPDLDFGTGDFMVAGWIKQNGTPGNDRRFFHRASPDNLLGAITLVVPNGLNEMRFSLRDSTGTSVNVVGTSSTTGNVFTHVVALRRNGIAELWINGVREATASAAGNVSNTAALLRVGNGVNTTAAPASNTDMALMRHSAYAPTPTQIRRMYRDELALFGTGVRCTLGGTSNAVQELAFDESQNTLIVGTGDGVSEFNGLVRTAYLDTSNVTGLTNDNIQAVGGAAGFRLIAGTAQAVARRDAVNGLDTMNRYGPRLPVRDGLMRSTGRTTDATPLNLSPRIFVGEREHIRGEVRVIGKMVGAAATQRFSALLEFVATRDAGGNVTLNLAAASQKDPLWNGTAAIDGTVETTSTTDAAVVVDTASQTLALQVTGIAATVMAWTAEWTYARISEETSYAA